MAEQNIANVTTIYGRTVTSTNLTNTVNTVLTCGANQIIKINTVIASNTGLTNAAVSLLYETDAYIAYNISIPPGSSIALVGKDTPIYLMETDVLRAAETLGSIHLIVSYEVILTS